jgi:hypothetical protein
MPARCIRRRAHVPLALTVTPHIPHLFPTFADVLVEGPRPWTAGMVHVAAPRTIPWVVSKDTRQVP